MRGIQDKYFGGRQYYNELHTPDFTMLAQAIGLQAWSVERAEDFEAVMTEALAMPGPSVVEVRMGQIGALKFAGPPQKTLFSSPTGRGRNSSPGKAKPPPGLFYQNTLNGYST